MSDILTDALEHSWGTSPAQKKREVIVFDTSSFDFLDANRTTVADKTMSSIAAVLGI